MNQIDLNGVHLNERVIEQLKALQEYDNSGADSHINMLVEAGDFMIENSFNFQDQEKELIQHVQSLILVREILKDLRCDDIQPEKTDEQ